MLDFLLLPLQVDCPQKDACDMSSFYKKAVLRMSKRLTKLQLGNEKEQANVLNQILLNKFLCNVVTLKISLPWYQSNLKFQMTAFADRSIACGSHFMMENMYRIHINTGLLLVFEKGCAFQCSNVSYKKIKKSQVLSG